MRTVYWEDQKVKMIDQRLLPGELVIAEFDTVEGTARSIREMYVRGAPAIGATAAYGMALAAYNSPAWDRDGLLNDLRAAKKTLDAARPTAVNLAWATARLMSMAEHTVLPTSTTYAARCWLRRKLSPTKTWRSTGAWAITARKSCRTGPTSCTTATPARWRLWTSGQRWAWSTPARSRASASMSGSTRRGRVCKARLTAWELMRAGVPMHLIADNAAGHLMRTGQVDVVLFGADRVAANGDVANKIGSYKLGVVARENGIPVYSVVPTSTIDLDLASGDEIPIEERGAEEVTHVGETQIAPDDAPVYNPAFDVTPHRYITGIITEEGICYPPFESSLRRAKEAAEARIRENRARRGTENG